MSRQPTVKEAVEFLVRHHREPVFREYRQQCLEDWRQKYGDGFAEQVKARVEAAWKK